jgi:hypothetical protein
MFIHNDFIWLFCTFVVLILVGLFNICFLSIACVIAGMLILIFLSGLKCDQLRLMGQSAVNVHSEHLPESKCVRKDVTAPEVLRFGKRKIHRWVGWLPIKYPNAIFGVGGCLVWFGDLWVEAWFPTPGGKATGVYISTHKQKRGCVFHTCVLQVLCVPHAMCLTRVCFAWNNDQWSDRVRNLSHGRCDISHCLRHSILQRRALRCAPV